jgi:DNA-binding transcriptional ArsR family regulator
MPSSSSPSPEEHAGLLQRFLVTSRRGEIVALINAARSESDLGAVVATELCEAFDAEIGFVLIARPGSATPELIACVGLIGDEPATILADPLWGESLSGGVAVTERGTDLLGLGICNLALAPHTAGGARLLVGVGRLYDQHFEELELALLDAVTKSAAQALERFGLERQLERAQEVEAVGPLGGGIPDEFYRTLATVIGQCDVGTQNLQNAASEVEAELREIRSAAESAGELVQQLLAFSRQQVRQQVALEADAVESRSQEETPLPVLAQLGSLADLFRLLGHPIRLRILLAFGSDTLSPSELEERLEVGLAMLAYHVGVLRDDGFLMLVDTRATRGALESFYRLTDRGGLARNVIAAAWREIGDIAEHP